MVETKVKSKVAPLRATRSGRIKANDGDTLVEVQFKVTNTRGMLTNTEMNLVRQQLLRNLASALKGLSFTDFGIDNTKVVG